MSKVLTIVITLSLIISTLSSCGKNFTSISSNILDTQTTKTNFSVNSYSLHYTFQVPRITYKIEDNSQFCSNGNCAWFNSYRQIIPVYSQHRSIYGELRRRLTNKDTYRIPEDLTIHIGSSYSGSSDGYQMFLEDDRIYEWQHNHVHEMTHTFQRGYNNMPTWYSEGEAYLMYVLVGKTLGHYSVNSTDYEMEPTYSDGTAAQYWGFDNASSQQYPASNRIVSRLYQLYGGDQLLQGLRKSMQSDWSSKASSLQAYNQAFLEHLSHAATNDAGINRAWSNGFNGDVKASLKRDLENWGFSF